jgi:hypothetical protein
MEANVLKINHVAMFIIIPMNQNFDTWANAGTKVRFFQVLPFNLPK